MTGAGGEGPLNLDSYYYSFDETGCRLVDELLAAVADAGHRSHHTEGWSERDDLRPDASPAGAIQQAAARLAQALASSEAARGEAVRRAAELVEQRDAAKAEAVEVTAEMHRTARRFRQEMEITEATRARFDAAFDVTQAEREALWQIADVYGVSRKDTAEIVRQVLAVRALTPGGAA